ncbi:MAG: methylated-DNA--[protein]-cysteine S-methyltransferase, partial [Planctomycetaceae bacterium]
SRARQDFPDHRETDWQPDLRAALQAYTRGAPISFDDIELDLEDYSDFQQRVMQGARSVRYGQRQTYGGLAAQAGTPGAARAVGNVMAGNRFPIIVPCHRIVLSNGGLGGFSAPRGVSLKQKLLNMESRQTGVDSRPHPMT